MANSTMIPDSTGAQTLRSLISLEPVLSSSINLTVLDPDPAPAGIGLVELRVFGNGGKY